MSYILISPYQNEKFQFQGLQTFVFLMPCVFLFFFSGQNIVWFVVTEAAGQQRCSWGPPWPPCWDRLGPGHRLWSCFQMFPLMGEKYVGRRSQKKILPNVAGAKTQSGFRMGVAMSILRGFYWQENISRCESDLALAAWVWIIEGLVMMVMMMLLPLLDRHNRCFHSFRDVSGNEATVTM